VLKVSESVKMVGSLVMIRTTITVIPNHMRKFGTMAMLMMPIARFVCRWLKCPMLAAPHEIPPKPLTPMIDPVAPIPFRYRMVQANVTMRRNKGTL
jgi:hypothetical protein